MGAQLLTSETAIFFRTKFQDRSGKDQSRFFKTIKLLTQEPRSQKAF